MKKIFFNILTVCLVTIISVVNPGYAFEGETIRHEGMSKDQADEILRELKQIRQLLEETIPKTIAKAKDRTPSDPPPENLVLSVEGEPFKGNAGAKVTLIEFSDYQCPFCARHFRHTLPQLEREYISTGKIRYVFRDFPLERIHPHAVQAARAANCAGKQGKYWEMHDWIFANQMNLDEEALKGQAHEMKLSMDEFISCLKDKSQEVEVKEDLMAGTQAGVRGTPTFFIGLTEPHSPNLIKVQRIIRGAHSYEALKQVIEDILMPT